MSVPKRRSLECFTDREVELEVRRWLATFGAAPPDGVRGARWHRSSVTDAIVNAGPGWRKGDPL